MFFPGATLKVLGFCLPSFGFMYLIIIGFSYFYKSNKRGRLVVGLSNGFSLMIVGLFIKNIGYCSAIKNSQIIGRLLLKLVDWF